MKKQITCLFLGLIPFLLMAFAPQPPFIDRFTLVTDESWEVSRDQTTFGKYPLSKEAILATKSGLKGGETQAVAAKFFGASTLIEGTKPIWRTYQASDDWESYQFRKVIMLRNNVVSQAVLKINCDDVARIYVNGELVIGKNLSRNLETSWVESTDFKQLSADFYNRIFTYDIKPYLKAGALNTLIVEAASKPVSNGHAYISAKLDVDFIQNTIALKPEIKPIKPEKKPPIAPKKPVEKIATVAKKEVKEAPRSVIRPIENEPIVQQKPTAAPETNVFKTSNDLKADKLKVGDIFELGNIFFKADDATLNSEAQETLLELAVFLKANTGIKIEIGGHTNLIPTNEYAYALSGKRAKSVSDFLRQNGIAADKLTFKGYGKSKPKSSEKTMESNQKNQRVEVKILAK